jgi:hypothetical protein
MRGASLRFEFRMERSTLDDADLFPSAPPVFSLIESRTIYRNDTPDGPAGLEQNCRELTKLHASDATSADRTRRSQVLLHPSSRRHRGRRTRVIPSHCKVATATADARIAATPQQKEEFAALIHLCHLCGAGAGESFARRGYRLAPGERCGDHDAATYLARVNTAKRQFQRLAAAD